MDYYLDIQVQPDLEISAPALMNNLFAKFHRNMAQAMLGEIAVSFPNTTVPWAMCFGCMVERQF